MFTTHTPEEAGNEKHDFHLCYNMSYFSGISEEEVRRVSGTDGEVFNHSLCIKNGSYCEWCFKLHGEVSREMWGKYSGICDIKSITNAQDYNFWADEKLYAAKDNADATGFDERKK